MEEKYNTRRKPDAIWHKIDGQRGVVVEGIERVGHTRCRGTHNFDALDPDLVDGPYRFRWAEPCE
jgi:hypothetical protein